MKQAIILFAILISAKGFAQIKDLLLVDDNSFLEVQEDENQKDADWIYSVVEEMPEYPGGVEAMKKYLKENLKYPEIDGKKKIEGVVYLHFVINRDGKLSDIQVLKGISRTFDTEAVRLIAAMPSWKPGKQGGQPVNVKYTLPVRFKLEGKNESKENK